MSVNVFVLGLPGSGKSTVSQYIYDYVNQLNQHWDWTAIRVSDYPILHSMYQAGKQHEWFRFAPYGGFEVLDSSVYDQALKRLEWEVWRRSLLPRTEKLLVVAEFARTDYHEAFNQFTNDFVQNAYFLFLDVDIFTCIRRVRERVTRRKSLDDHFVPLKAFKAYYQSDNRSSFSSALKARGIDDKRFLIIDNSGTVHDVMEKVKDFVELLLKQAALI